MIKPKIGPKNEIQCMRKDGVVVHFAVPDRDVLGGVFSAIEKFYFGREIKPGKYDIEDGQGRS